MYYARLIHFKLGTGQRLVAENITKEFDQLTRNLYGFRGNVYFFDDRSGEYRALNYWDTKNDAENANDLLFPKLKQKLLQYTKEEPTYRYFEVYDPYENGNFTPH